jgi:restriction endonuclease Mrr
MGQGLPAVEHIDPKVVLIDGRRLAELMMISKSASAPHGRIR